MNAEPKQIKTQLELTHEQNNAAVLNVFTVVMLCLLLFGPQYLPDRVVTIILGVVPAICMTWYLHQCPGSLRNRRGSLGTAINLLVFLWIVAVASVVAILTGVIV